MTKNDLYWYGVIVEVHVRAMGMYSENQFKVFTGEAPEFRLSDFEELLKDHGINHNSLVEGIMRGD